MEIWKGIYGNMEGNIWRYGGEYMEIWKGIMDA